jgi:hypothetical protein
MCQGQKRLVLDFPAGLLSSAAPLRLVTYSGLGHFVEPSLPGASGITSYGIVNKMR